MNIRKLSGFRMARTASCFVTFLKLCRKRGRSCYRYQRFVSQEGT
jgi:hypothetical protein